MWKSNSASILVSFYWLYRTNLYFCFSQLKFPNIVFKHVLFYWTLGSRSSSSKENVCGFYFVVFFLIFTFNTGDLRFFYVFTLWIRIRSRTEDENIKRFNRVTATRRCWRLQFLKHQYNWKQILGIIYFSSKICSLEVVIILLV